MNPKDYLTFPDIYDAFQPKIVRYLARLVGEPESEDLAQEVFVKINRALPNFRGESQLSTWVYRIATNTALDRLRSPSFRQSSISENTLEETAKEDLFQGKKALPVEQQVVRQEMNACIRDVIDTLPENYRTVLVLKDIEGLKAGEIAGILGITVGTVKIRLHRARARLKQALENQCCFYHDERNELACELPEIPPKSG